MSEYEYEYECDLCEDGKRFESNDVGQMAEHIVEEHPIEFP